MQNAARSICIHAAERDDPLGDSPERPHQRVRLPGTAENRVEYGVWFEIPEFRTVICEPVPFCDDFSEARRTPAMEQE